MEMENVLTEEGWDYVIDHMDFLPEDKNFRTAILAGFVGTMIGAC